MKHTNFNFCFLVSFPFPSSTRRKKILDFYHRSSLTAYCTAFAYCPILFPLGGDVSDKYLELPPEGHQVNYAHSPTPAPLILNPELLAQGKQGLVRNATSHYSSNGKNET
jgi:hypothetical protein